MSGGPFLLLMTPIVDVGYFTIDGVTAPICREDVRDVMCSHLVTRDNTDLKRRLIEILGDYLQTVEVAVCAMILMWDLEGAVGDHLLRRYQLLGGQGESWTDDELRRLVKARINAIAFDRVTWERLWRILDEGIEHNGERDIFPLYPATIHVQYVVDVALDAGYVEEWIRSLRLAVAQGVGYLVVEGVSPAFTFDKALHGFDRGKLARLREISA